MRLWLRIELLTYLLRTYKTKRCWNEKLMRQVRSCKREANTNASQGDLRFRLRKHGTIQGWKTWDRKDLLLHNLQLLFSMKCCLYKNFARGSSFPVFYFCPVTTLRSSGTSASEDSVKQVSHVNMDKWALTASDFPQLPYLLYLSHIFPEKLEHVICVSRADLALSPALETFPNPFLMPIAQSSLPELVFLFSVI